MANNWLKLSLDGTDVGVVAALQLTNTRMLEAATQKMTFLIDKLEEKLRSGGPRTIPDVLAANLKNQGARNEGGNILGTMEWTGNTDFYDISPLGRATGLTGPGQKRGGTRKHGKGTPRVFGRDVLEFYWPGHSPSNKRGTVNLMRVWHPPFPGRDIIVEAIQGMRNEIQKGLDEAIRGVKIDLRKF